MVEKFSAPMVEKEKPSEPIKIEKDKVIVMGVEIPKNSEPGLRTPNPEKFKDFIQDEFSLKLLQKIAKGIALNQPTMIEGEAAIGKSYAIEYLAHLANQEVYRMSLNGQTETTDLIGKWVPQTETARKKVTPLLDNPHKCKSPEAKKLIELKKITVSGEAKKEAIEEGREKNMYVGFSKEEMQEICRLEGIEIGESEWVWQDGEMPREIENGAWTVLDEANTCEPQVLVRLNAILERGGELILQENGGKIVKPKDPTKTHRMFMTVNPPGGKYRGRVPFSAEYISRFNYQNIGILPLETAIFRAKAKNGCKVELPIEKLSQAQAGKATEIKKMTDRFEEEWVADFTEKYITAFYKIQELVSKNEIARDQEQKFDYDQRDWDRFENYVKYFAELGKIKKTIEDAIEYTVLGKIKSENDRQKVKDIVLNLVKVSEPKIKIVEDISEQQKLLRNLEANILADSSIAEAHKEIILSKKEFI